MTTAVWCWVSLWASVKTWSFCCLPSAAGAITWQVVLSSESMTRAVVSVLWKACGGWGVAQELKRTGRAKRPVNTAIFIISPKYELLKKFGLQITEHTLVLRADSMATLMPILFTGGGAEFSGKF